MKKMVLLFATGMLAMVILAAIWMFQETTVRASQSPNGRYLLVVLKRNLESILPVMPGQGSDAPCHVELRERESGRLIVRKEVAMLQDVEQIQWEQNKIWINPRFAIPYDGSDLGNGQPGKQGNRPLENALPQPRFRGNPEFRGLGARSRNAEKLDGVGLENAKSGA